MNEERQRIREDLARDEMRTRTLAETQEQALLHAQARLREEARELEVREENRRAQAERSHLDAVGITRAHDDQAERVMTMVAEKMQKDMFAFQRTTQDDYDRLVRELRQRDEQYLADAQQKQKSIDQLTAALTAALSRHPVAALATAAGGAAPPPPPGGGDAPGAVGEPMKGEA